jgi:hypothetical protein
VLTGSVETIFTATMIRDNLQRRLTWQTGMVCGSSRQRAAELARSVTAAANEIQPRARRNLLLGHLKVHGRSMSSQVQPTNRSTCMCEMRCCEECCEICCIDCCCFIPVLLSVFAIPFCLCPQPTPPLANTHTHGRRQNVAQTSGGHSKITPRPTFPTHFHYLICLESLPPPLISLSPSLAVRVTRATLVSSETQLPSQSAKCGGLSEPGHAPRLSKADTRGTCD